MRFTALLVLLASTFATAGCSFDPTPLTDDTQGDLGKARYSYSSSDCSFVGCNMGHAALQGSLVTVDVTSYDPETRLRAFLGKNAVGKIAAQTEDCSCSDGHTSTGIAPALKCPADQAKSCSLSVDIETSAAGHDELQLFAGSQLFDKVAIVVKPASRIDVSVTVDGAAVTPGPDSVYVVKQASIVHLASQVFGDDGTPLVFTQHGVDHVYENRAIVRPDPNPLDDLFGSTSVELVDPVAAGEASVTVTAVGASRVARFRVQ